MTIHSQVLDFGQFISTDGNHPCLCSRSSLYAFHDLIFVLYEMIRANAIQMTNKLYKMLLHIAPHRFLRDIQAEFNKAYPFLKLEFFTGKPRPFSDLAGNLMLSGNKKISETQLKPTEGYIEINEQMKVTDLENIFRDQFRLAAQVFRKSGNLWLETTITDGWTLEQQNTHGREISTTRTEREEANDYDLNRDADN